MGIEDVAVYYEGDELPALSLTWLGDDGAVLDLSAGAAQAVKVGAGPAAGFTKTTGITLAASAPNFVIAWAAAGELNALVPGEYVIECYVTVSSKTRTVQGRLRIRPKLA